MMMIDTPPGFDNNATALLLAPWPFSPHRRLLLLLLLLLLPLPGRPCRGWVVNGMNGEVTKCDGMSIDSDRQAMHPSMDPSPAQPLQSIDFDPGPLISVPIDSIDPWCSIEMGAPKRPSAIEKYKDEE